MNIESRKLFSTPLVDTAFLFVNDLGADYLEMSSFVMSLEDQFDFECQYTKDGELPALATVQDAIDFVISEGGI